MHSFTHRIAGAALLAAAAAPTVAQDVLVQAKRVVIAPGTVLEDSALLIRDGKVAYVGEEILQDMVVRAKTAHPRAEFIHCDALGSGPSAAPIDGYGYPRGRSAYQKLGP